MTRRQPYAVSAVTMAEGGTVAAKPNPRARAISRTLRAQAIMKGNVRALRHGVYSEVAVRADVLDEAAFLFSRAPWLDRVRDGVLVEGTARLIVRLRKLDAVLDAKPSAILTSMYSRCESQLTRNLAELGLTPRAAADLGLAHMDARAKAGRAAEARLAEYAPDKRT